MTSRSRFSQLTDGLSHAEELLTIPAERRPSGPPASAVLVLLSDQDDPDLVFTERNSAMRSHAGQISFPGGRVDPDDADLASTALREAREEVGLDSAAVSILGQLPVSHIPVSSANVAPIVATWAGDQQLEPASPREVASVQRWTISELTDPERRVMAYLPSGHRGPAWQFGDLFLWGFTAMTVDALLTVGGWNQPWDRSREVLVPQRFHRDRR